MVALLGARQAGKTTLAREAVQRDPAHPRHSIWRSPLTVKPWERLLIACFATAMDRSWLTKSNASQICSRSRVRSATTPSAWWCFCSWEAHPWTSAKVLSETLARKIRLINVNGFSLSEVGQECQDQPRLQGWFPEPMLLQPLKLGCGGWSPLRVHSPRGTSVGRGFVDAGRNRFPAADRGM